MVKTASLVALAMLASASLVTVSGQQAGSPAKSATHSYRRQVPKKLAAEAKITEDSARAIAMSKVPTGKVRALELERENGKLMYSFDIKIPGKSGIEEVNVNALDGTVIGVEHEDAKTEAREKAAEAKEKAAAKKKT